MNEIVLQEKRTLDEVLLTAVRTFPNGCNYRLVKEPNGDYYLELGCYGVHINLVTGGGKLLWRWFGEKVSKRKLSGIVKPETILELLKKSPCKRCGGARFYKETGT